MPYPNALDNLATDKADATPEAGDHASHHNALAAAINAIEAELGLNPRGASASVAAALAALVASATLIPLTPKAASFTLALTDAGTLVYSNAAGAVVGTVPTNASVAFPVGTNIPLGRYGAGTFTIAAAGGVTIRSISGHLAIADQYGGGNLHKIAADEWWLVGDLA